MKPNPIVLALAGLVVAMPVLAQRYSAYDEGYADVVTCESAKRRVAYCEADTRDGVHLLEQLSKTECIEGENWGYDRGRIWVDDGCAGRFGVGGKARYGDARDHRRDGDWRDGRRDSRYDSRRVEPAVDPGPYQGQGRITILCESKDNRRRYCPIDLRDRIVSVYANISTIPCDENRNWGYDQGGVWVDGGCRAEFAVGAAGLLQPR